MPEVVRAMAQPLSNVDKITIVSTGNGTGAGASKITGDMAQIAAQVPALFEALSGMSMSELLNKVKGIGDKAPKPDGVDGKSDTASAKKAPN
jgi:flotillin